MVTHVQELVFDAIPFTLNNDAAHRSDFQFSSFPSAFIQK